MKAAGGERANRAAGNERDYQSTVSRMDELDPRVRVVCDLNVAEVREYSGRHEYDGIPQDLSPSGVAAGLRRLAAARESGAACPDPHDEAHLRAF